MSAVNLDECPYLNRKLTYRKTKVMNRGTCRCGACKICGFPKHSAVHGPVYGQPPGTKPWDHEFVSEIQGD